MLFFLKLIGWPKIYSVKRSYGTITTFRSYTSDLKDSPSGDNSNVTKETKEILPVKPTKKSSKTKTNSKEDQTNASKAEHIERRSLTKAKGVFLACLKMFLEVKARASLHQFKECLKKLQRHPKSQ
ncbi:ATV_HP_G0103600.mRNA.1.CDS.1 [Saccharomyces cerevisiae]|nr:ATV_HP_G0103600.mRNA.1.CDS.1 [Saccharomyces cerevisiae]CAI6619251.1 ATV_HP_G0103600.mRNA.1.CDS.1 [Saccharomyces cerevisiae]